MFFICKSIYTLNVYSIHYTLRQNANVKKNSFEKKKKKKKRYKNALFSASSNSSQFYFYDSYMS